MSENQQEKSKNGIQVISRAAAILRVLRDSQSGMSLGQIASRVDLPRSTVQRIAGALVTEGLLIADRQGRGLRIGPELTAMAGAAQYNIVEHCRLFLTELTQKTGETADLSVMRGAGMVFLDQVPGTHRLTTVSRVGEVFPLTSTANGRSCLAALPEKEATQIILNEWTRNGTNGDLAGLLATLETIRQSGIAFDTDNHFQGISAAGIAFRDWSGELHAISIPVPSTRFAANRDHIVKALSETAQSLAGSFGTRT